MTRRSTFAALALTVAALPGGGERRNWPAAGAQSRRPDGPQFAGSARGTGAAAARGRLRGQPVCLRRAVPRDCQAGGDDLRCTRAAVGADLAHLPAPGAGQDAGRHAGDSRRHRHRRPRRHVDGLCRPAPPADGIRTRRRRGVRLAGTEPHVPARYQRRRSCGRATRDPPRLRHRGQPPRHPRVPVGAGRRPVFPGRDVPPFTGRDAAWARACGKRRRLPLSAEDRAAGSVRLVSLRQPVGPRRRLLGAALHLGCLWRRQLLRHAVFRVTSITPASSAR